MDLHVVGRMLEAVFLPPGLYLLLGVLGLVLSRFSMRAAQVSLGVVVLGLYVLSAPVTASLLANTLEFYPPFEPDSLVGKNAEAIVVLADGSHRHAPEYGSSTVSPQTLERLRFAARIHEATGLPVMATGGATLGDVTSNAQRMATVLREDFGVAPVWREERGNDTVENARYSAEALNKRGLTVAILVTDAVHMPRAMASFQNGGPKVIAAPTGYSSARIEPLKMSNWVPTAASASYVAGALGELLGLTWYRLTT